MKPMMTSPPTPQPGTQCIPLAEEHGAEVARWVLRLVMQPRPFRRLCQGHNQDMIFRELGLEGLLTSDASQQVVFEALTGIAARLDGEKGEASHPPSRNFRQLATWLNLSPGEQILLRFAMALAEVPVLRESLELLDSQSTHTLHATLAHVLGMSPTDVRRALNRSGPLAQAGVLSLQSDARNLSTTLDLLDGLNDALLGDEEDLLLLFRTYFRVAPPPRLTVADYPHLREDIAVMRRCVTAATGTTGTNLLLYGRPGTGKTAFVRALAADLGLPLYEVSSEDEEGDSKGEGQRFRAYQLCQRVLARFPASLILFDEIEDVFPAPLGWGWGNASRTGSHKAWTNQLLETNPVPTVWLSNAVGQMDPAFLRRFTYSLEFRTPPRSVRRRMVETNVRGLPVSPAWIERVARNEHLTPAQIEQAGRLARTVRAQESQDAEHLMERVMSRSLEVLGHPGGLLDGGKDLAPPYRLTFLNHNCDVERVTEGLVRRPQGRLCLYGPPGSGKTAYVRHLAERLDKPLLCKQASDLLSRWVGGTEANLAELFRQARAEGAVLLLDEADSFLQDRRNAQRSWEITQVNELLVQMEAFRGLFLCSTNLMETLDAAVLRRFDLKIRFGYLRPEQAWALVRETLAYHGVPDLSQDTAAACRRRLAALTTLTPGDMATVLRQARILDQEITYDGVLAALEEECQAKLQGRKPVTGFAG